MNRNPWIQPKIWSALLKYSFSFHSLSTHIWGGLTIFEPFLWHLNISHQLAFPNIICNIFFAEETNTDSITYSVGFFLFQIPIKHCPLQNKIDDNVWRWNQLFFAGLSDYILVAVNVNLNQTYTFLNLKSTSLKLTPFIRKEISHFFRWLILLKQAGPCHVGQGCWWTDNLTYKTLLIWPPTSDWKLKLVKWPGVCDWSFHTFNFKFQLNLNVELPLCLSF